MRDGDYGLAALAGNTVKPSFLNNCRLLGYLRTMARNYKQGIFHPTNPSKYVGDADNIVFRSSWESKVMRWFDTNPSVIRWNSEELVVPYFSEADQKMRRYFVDFVVRLRTKEGKEEVLMVEVKPDSQTKIPVATRGKKTSRLLTETYTYMVNRDKWNAATAYAEKNGMKFVILTEYHLGIAKRK